MTPNELFYLIDNDKQPPECIEIISTAFDTIRRAALRERDAEHEVALKKARADALEQARAACRSVARVRKIVRSDRAGSDAALACSEALRVLLEEAGK